jgi:hypothetical protein
LTFDGKTKVATDLDRFAPCTIEAWATALRSDYVAPAGDNPPQYGLIGADIPFKGGYTVGVYFQPDRRTPAGLIVMTKPDATFRFPAPVRLGAVQHYCVVFGGSEVRAYLDGKLLGRERHPNQSDPGTPFILGHVGLTNDSPHHGFVGSMRSVRVSRGERYNASFDPPADFTPDATALLIFAGGPDGEGRLKDLSGNGNDGRVTPRPAP